MRIYMLCACMPIYCLKFSCQVELTKNDLKHALGLAIPSEDPLVSSSSSSSDSSDSDSSDTSSSSDSDCTGNARQKTPTPAATPPESPAADMRVLFKKGTATLKVKALGSALKDYELIRVCSATEQPRYDCSELTDDNFKIAITAMEDTG
jgi:hypothetical protein